MSKAGVWGAADKAMMKQLSGYPQALGMSSGVMLVLAMLPGIPMLPFLVLGGGAAPLDVAEQPRRPGRSRRCGTGCSRCAAAAEEPISAALKIDDLKIELGYALLPLVNTPSANGGSGNRLTDQIKGLRRQLAGDMGFVLPSVRIQDNLQLGANNYVIRIKEIEAGTWRHPPQHAALVMDPKASRSAAGR